MQLSPVILDKIMRPGHGGVFLVGMVNLLDGVLNYCIRFRGYQSYYEAGANSAICCSM